MKILFVVRKDFHQVKGGAFIQISKYIEYLEKKNHEVILFNNTLDFYQDFTGIDVIHLTDLTWTYENIINIKSLKTRSILIPIVLSTIYWPLDDYAKNGAPFIQRMAARIGGVDFFDFLKSVAKYLKTRDGRFLNGIKSRYLDSQREICKHIDLFLPNSEIEMSVLNERLGTKYSNFSVVYNAIDLDLFKRQKDNYNLGKKGILFVGRIDPRKNQYKFLESIMDNNEKVTFVGNAGPNSLKYYDKLVKLAKRRGNVEFISHVTYSEVFDLMLKSKVHVLTSWVETPGLVSLEAGFADCNLVVCDKGSVREYLDDYAFYCEPNNLLSIKLAVNEALNADTKPLLASHISGKFNWEKVTDDLVSAYSSILEKNKI